jgi:hypothetical protein
MSAVRPVSGDRKLDTGWGAQVMLSNNNDSNNMNNTINHIIPGGAWPDKQADGAISDCAMSQRTGTIREEK